MSIQLFAQFTETNYTTHDLVEERVLNLNGKLRESLATGQSKVIIPVDLPKGTVEWYYSFTTSSGFSGTDNLKLALQLSAVAIDQTGIVSGALSKIQLPKGSNVVNSHLLDSPNRDLFMSGRPFRHYEEGSASSAKQAIVRVDDVLEGRLYIAIENPSDLNAVVVAIEVAAIVKSQQYIDKWNEQNLGKMKASCLNALFSSEPQKNKEAVCACYTEKFKTRFLPSQISELRKGDINFRRDILDECFTATGNEKLRLAEKNADDIWSQFETTAKEAHAASAFGNHQLSKEKYLEAVLLIENSPIKHTLNNPSFAGFYSSVAWSCLLTNDMLLAEQYLQRGLALDHNNMYLWGNTGMFHLLKNNYSMAKTAFSRYGRRDKLPDGRRWGEVVEQDLILFEDLGMGNDGFDKVRDILKIKK